MAGLYDGLDSFSKLGIPMPNPAPEIEAPSTSLTQPISHLNQMPTDYVIDDPNEPKKKKYAKEAWPGKKPAAGLLV